MSIYEITNAQTLEGVWKARLTITGGSPQTAPQITVTHNSGTPIPDFTVTPNEPDQWDLCVPVPKESISDGVQTFLISDKDTGNQIGHFTLICGESVNDDLRAEIALLRAELDMLKRAFRRHCVETQ